MNQSMSPFDRMSETRWVSDAGQFHNLGIHQQLIDSLILRPYLDPDMTSEGPRRCPDSVSSSVHEGTQLCHQP